MFSNRNRPSSSLRSFLITCAPIALGIIIMLIPFPESRVMIKYLLTWTILLIGPVIIIVRKEIPRLPPLSSTVGRPAVIYGWVCLSIWLFLGLLFLLEAIFG